MKIFVHKITHGKHASMSIDNSTLDIIMDGDADAWPLIDGRSLDIRGKSVNTFDAMHAANATRLAAVSDELATLDDAIAAKQAEVTQAEVTQAQQTKAQQTKANAAADSVAALQARRALAQRQAELDALQARKTALQDRQTRLQGLHADLTMAKNAIANGTAAPENVVPDNVFVYLGWDGTVTALPEYASYGKMGDELGEFADLLAWLEWDETGTPTLHVKELING